MSEAKRTRRRRPRVALCAAITFDGKLDTSAPLPPTFHDFLASEDGDQLVDDPDRFRALFDAGRVDDVYLLVRPRVDGRRDAPTLSGPFTPEFFPRSISCRLRRMEVVSGECLLHYTVIRGGKNDASARP